MQAEMLAGGIISHPPFWTLYGSALLAICQWRNVPVRNLCLVHMLVCMIAIVVATGNVLNIEDVYHQQVMGHWLMITSQLSKLLLVLLLLCFDARYLNMTALQVLVLYLVLSVLEIIYFADRFIFVSGAPNDVIVSIYPGLHQALELLVLIALGWPLVAYLWDRYLRKQLHDDLHDDDDEYDR